MAILTPKIAVYYGTITLIDGTPATYTALEIATLYNVADRTYEAIPLTGPSPFAGKGLLELEYIHLKPLPRGDYYDAVERYNLDHEVQYDEDFDPRAGGKWAVPYRHRDDESRE